MPDQYEARLRRVLISLLICIASIVLLGFIWGALQTIGGILFLFLLAWLISFILSPVANGLQRLRLRRIWAVALVYLALTVVLFGGIALAVPLISAEVQQVAARVTTLASPDNLAQLNHAAVTQLVQFGVTPHDAQHIIDQVTTNFQSGLQRGVSGALTNATDLLSSIASIFLNTVIVLIISFYIMLDGRRLADQLTLYLPVPWREFAGEFEGDIARVFGGFIRSQVFIGLAYSVLAEVALLGLGIPNGLVISLIAGVVMIIPFAGPFLAILPPMALTLLESPPTLVVRNEIIMLIALFVAQQLVMQGLAPRIMSQGVGLHPLWLFAALLMGAKEAGVWGAFFAAPIAALLAIIFKEAHSYWTRNSPLFATADHNGHSPTPPERAPTEGERAPEPATQ